MRASGKLRRTTRALSRLHDAWTAPSGVRATQLPILVALGSDGDLSVTSLADALEVDSSTLGRTLKVLEDRGLIRVDDAAMVSLTLEGSRVLAGALARWQAMQRSVVAQLGRPHLEALYDELDALSAL